MHQPSSNGPVSDQLNRLEGDSAQTGGCHALTERLHRLEAELADRDVFIGSLRKRQAKLAARADLLAGELSRLQQLHTLVVNSRSWKLTKPLRFVARLLRGEWGTVSSACRWFAAQAGIRAGGWNAISAEPGRRNPRTDAAPTSGGSGVSVLSRAAGDDPDPRRRKPAGNRGVPALDRRKSASDTVRGIGGRGRFRRRGHAGAGRRAGAAL